MFPFVAEFTTGGCAVELPVDLDTVAIHPPVPGFRLLTQSLEIGNAPTPQTLPREDPDFDLRLIEPTSVSWRVEGMARPALRIEVSAKDQKELRKLVMSRLPAWRRRVTVQTAMVVDFAEGGGWALAGAGDGSEPQSVNS
jgi:hypothetical protein